MTSEQVVQTAREWLGVPWKHQGRSTAGVDCAGLVVMVAQALDLTHFDSRDYGRFPNKDRMREMLREQCVERSGEPLPGMVALMQFSSEPRHMGFIVPYRHGGVALLHALTTAGKVVEHRVNAAWRGSIVGIFDLPGVHRG